MTTRRRDFITPLRPELEDLARRVGDHRSALGLYVILLSEADHRDGVLRASGRQIASWYDWSRGGVQRDLRLLETLGLIVWERERVEGSTGPAQIVIVDYFTVMGAKATGTLTGTLTGTPTGTDSGQSVLGPQPMTPDSEGGQEVQDNKTLSLGSLTHSADAQIASAVRVNAQNIDQEGDRAEAVNAP